MKWVSLVIISFIICLTLTSAVISIDVGQEKKYYLGDSIEREVSIFRDSKTEGLVSAKVLCEKTSFTYFTTPVSISGGSLEKVSLPSFNVNKNMIGKCQIVTMLNDFEGGKIEEYIETDITVSSELPLKADLQKNNYLPGEEVSVSLFLNRSGDYNAKFKIENGIMNLNFEKNFSGNSGVISLLLPVNSIPGSAKILVSLDDIYDNAASKSFDFNIEAVPTKIDVDIKKRSLRPGEGFQYLVKVYDQANGSLDRETQVNLIDQLKNLVRSKNGKSGVQDEIGIPQGTKPGNYHLIAQSLNLQVEEIVEVLAYRNISLSLSKDKIIITNTGNILYEDDIKVDAQNGERIYRIPISVYLLPGEYKTILLNEELPDAEYRVNVSSTSNKFSFDTVITKDSRSLSKKVAQGIQVLTGSSIVDTHDVSSFFILIVIMAGFIGGLFLYTHTRLRSYVKGNVEGAITYQKAQIGGLQTSLVKEKNQKEHAEKMFGKYVDYNVLKQTGPEGHVQRQRKDISMLFTDLRGFSKLFDTMDDLEVSKLLDSIFNVSDKAVSRNGGTINKFVGDSVLALFNASKSHNNHLLSCVKTALEIQSEIAILNEKLIRKGSEPVRIGIGIGSGMAAVGTMGSNEKLEFTAIGVPVNLAARLQAQARGGQILIAKEVYDKIRDKVRVEYIGEIQLKNITGLTQVYNIKSLKENEEINFGVKVKS